MVEVLSKMAQYGKRKANLNLLGCHPLTDTVVLPYNPTK